MFSKPLSSELHKNLQHYYIFEISNVRLRANGRNIVDQQLPTLLDVTCCVRFHTLLHVVGSMLLRVVVQSLKPVKLFSEQFPTFLLFRDRRSV